MGGGESAGEKGGGSGKRGWGGNGRSADRPLAPAWTSRGAHGDVDGEARQPRPNLSKGGSEVASCSNSIIFIPIVGGEEEDEEGEVGVRRTPPRPLSADFRRLSEGGGGREEEDEGGGVNVETPFLPDRRIGRCST